MIESSFCAITLPKLASGVLRSKTGVDAFRKKWWPRMLALKSLKTADALVGRENWRMISGVRSNTAGWCAARQPASYRVATAPTAVGADSGEEQV